MSESTWTNSTIRKRLGECGFIQVKDRDELIGQEMRSYWQRGSVMLLLYEHPSTAPALFDHYGNEIKPEELGVRNENTQTGNHP
jgi:hypothetical protein